MQNCNSKSENLNQKGFTLIELLLYISLTGIILLSVSVFYFETLRSRVKNQTIAEVEQQGTIAMEQITQAIRNSSSIASPAVGTSAAAITLTSTTPAKNPTVFDLTTGTIRVSEDALAPVNLTTPKVAITALNFQNLSAASTKGVIKVSFTVSYINNSGRNEYDFSKTFTGAASLR
ncbi:MAG: prepilin-type N-terminal cleavage/methylation domain-containing protein [Candidatus Berkelbacteria bacterium]